MKAAQRTLNPGSLPSGALAHHDATLITGTADGGSLTNWLDVSGNSNDLTSGASVTYYNTTSAKLINGNPAVWFSSLTSSLKYASLSLPQPFTIAVVAQEATGSTSAGILYNNTPARGLSLNTSAGTYDINFGANAGAGTTDNAVHTIVAVINGASSSLTIDGVTTSSLNPGSNGFSGVVWVGSVTGAASPLNGPIGELVIYPSALNATQVSNIRAYLKPKWGTP